MRLSSYLRWLLLVLSLPLGVVGAFYGAVMFLMAHAAQEGAVTGGTPIYVAKDEEAFWGLEKLLNDAPYLQPSQFKIASKSFPGRIVALKSETRVHYQASFSMDHHQLVRLTGGLPTMPVVLRVKVEEGDSRGSSVLVPRQYARYVIFQGRFASL